MEQKLEQKKKLKLSWNEIVFFLKKYGFIIQSAKIYQDLKSSYDFGPFGTLIQEEIKKKWKEKFIISHSNIHQIKTSIFTSPKALESSQHLQKFVDFIYKCQNCNHQNKVDLIIEKKTQRKIICQNCNHQITNDFVSYQLLFDLFVGNVKEKGKKVFLRPETAQGIFINFRHLMRSLHLKLPFGLAQIGKAFRNEFTTKYGIFRTFEFEQMELEFFYSDCEKNERYFEFWKNKIINFLENVLFINKNNYRLYQQKPEELAHYAKKTIDFEFKFPFGWKEVWGLADRGDFDISNHHQNTKEDLRIVDNFQKFSFPFVIEPSCGVERLFLALIINHLQKDDDQKYTLNLPFAFCYYQIAIFPLTSKLKKDAQKILTLFQKTNYRVFFDERKSIGKRYFFHDAIGTYFCITFDFDSLVDQKVTVRVRKTKKQKRILISSLLNFFTNELKNC